MNNASGNFHTILGSLSGMSPEQRGPLIQLLMSNMANQQRQNSQNEMKPDFNFMYGQ